MWSERNVNNSELYVILNSVVHEYVCVTEKQRNTKEPKQTPH